MSRRQRGAPAKPDTSVDSAQSAAGLANGPAELPAPRTVAFTAAALAFFCVVMIALWLGKTAGIRLPFIADWDPESMFVFTCGVLTIALGALHPCFGLAFLAFLRPWLDGVTYSGDNLYFLGAILYLFVLWAVRLVWRGGSLHGKAPALLLAGFLAVAAVTAPASYQLDNTITQLLLWTGFLALFILAGNGLRLRAAFMVALCGFSAALLFQSIYALLHYRYVLPYVRAQMLEDPDLLRQFFRVPTAEVIRRLNLNRAFGTMLHPNTFASFMIMGIPASVGMAAYCTLNNIRAARAWRESGASGGSVRALAGWTLAGAVLLVSFVTVLYSTFAAPDLGTEVVLGIALAAGFLVGGGHAVAVARYARSAGVRAAAYAVGAYVHVAMLPVLLLALWLSYSRGAMMALAVAALTAGLLLLSVWFSGRRTGGRPKRTAALGLLLLAGAAVLAGQAAPGAPAVNTPALAQANTSALTGQPAAEANTPALGTQGPRRPRPELRMEGETLTAAELMSGASFRLRLGYWKIGLRMAKAHPWTGVGFGNFGVAYPKFQTLDAGDVKAAHNSLVKALAETGVFGLLTFSLYWGFVIFWGGYRVLKERDTAERWLLLAIHAAILAFLAHSLLDFGFYNPSLIFFAFLLTGLFFARAVPAAAEATPVGTARPAVQVAALGMLVAAALVAGYGYRVYAQHYALCGTRLNIASWERLERQNETSRIMVREVGQYYGAMRRAEREGAAFNRPAPSVPMPLLHPFLLPAFEAGELDRTDARGVLEAMGTLIVPAPGGGWRRVAQGEPLRGDVRFLADKWPSNIFEVTRLAARLWAEELEAIDRLFPHRPELAAYISDYYELLCVAHTGPRHKADFNRCLDRRLHWAREAVRRSPELADYQSLYGRALWYRAQTAPQQEARRLNEEGLSAFRRAQRLASQVSPDVNWQLHTALQRYGRLLLEAGDSERGQALLDESEEYADQARRIIRVRGRLGLS
jgi:hypothetical protein